MPIDLRSELQRPIAIALAGVALVGWLLFLIVLVNLSQENRQARDQVVQLQSSETRLRSELESQRRAAGSLADLQARIAAADQTSSQASRARDEAQAQLASVQQNLQAGQQRAAEASRTADAAAQRLGELQRQGQETEQRLAALRGEITRASRALPGVPGNSRRSAGAWKRPASRRRSSGTISRASRRRRGSSRPNSPMRSAACSRPATPRPRPRRNWPPCAPRASGSTRNGATSNRRSRLSRATAIA